MRIFVYILPLLLLATGARADDGPAVSAAEVIRSRASSEEIRGTVSWSAVAESATALEPWRGTPEQQLILAVAAVAANESAMQAPGDAALIWQVVRSRRRTTATRLAWLRVHSSRVLGDDCERRDRNCWWSRNLTWGPRRPSTWPPGWRWRPKRWLQLLAVSRDLVRGRLHFEPCHSEPWTWGGNLDVRDALSHGLVPLGCWGSLNEGFVPASGFPPP